MPIQNPNHVFLETGHLMDHLLEVEVDLLEFLIAPIHAAVGLGDPNVGFGDLNVGLGDSNVGFGDQFQKLFFGESRWSLSWSVSAPLERSSIRR